MTYCSGSVPLGESLRVGRGPQGNRRRATPVTENDDRDLSEDETP